MGGHHHSTKQAPILRVKKKSKQKPPLPNNIGRSTSWKNINGVRRKINIIDEIRRVQSNNDNKVIVLQKLKHEHNGAIEYRLGYYMIGVKPRMAGKWTWGQFATIVPAVDFRALIKKPSKLGWF